MNQFPTNRLIILFMASISLFWIGCSPSQQGATAADILGNPNKQAISYGGYRTTSRDTVPTVDQIKDDMRILSAMGIKILRTYNTELAELPNLLKAITALKKEDSSFEMYVMMGAWINCKGAFTDSPDHSQEDEVFNKAEIERAVQYAQQYPDIIKIISVGNEAMVHWAASYFVSPSVILKWVNYVQDLKAKGDLPDDLWVTSSDNFASWGGGDASYHNEDLDNLIKAVDYISVHTYPFHDTHYNQKYWVISQENTQNLTKLESIDDAMKRAKDYAISQYNSVKDYVTDLGINKPLHIGETGWATVSSGLYGSKGSQAADEYKQALYYNHMREWTSKNNISCFFFEAFDEIWKDASNSQGSENHFGLFTIDGKAKYALWSSVDEGIFSGLTRDGNTIEKTFNGSEQNLLDSVLPPLILKPEINQ